MPRLDDIDLDAVEDRIPPPDRVQVLLEKLVSRRAEFAGNVDARLDGLRAEPNLYGLLKPETWESMKACLRQFKSYALRRQNWLQRSIGLLLRPPR